MKQRTFFSKLTALLMMFALLATGYLITLPVLSVNAEVVTLPGGVSSEELAAYWKFDQTSGNIATDSSGHGRHLTLLTGSTAQWLDNGPVDGTRSFQFNGTSAFLLWAGNSFNETAAGGQYWIQSDYHADGIRQKTEDDQSLTISFFIQIDDIVYNPSAPDVNGFNLLFGNEGLGVGIAGSIEGAILNAEHFAATGNLDVGSYDPDYDDSWLFCGIKGTGGIMGGTDKVVSPDNVNDKLGGEWTMVTYVIDDSFERGTSSLKYYVNGALVRSESLSLTEGLTKTMGNAFNAFCIGGWKGETPGASTARGFYGSMSEFMVFTRALEASEVATLAASYGTDNTPDPITITLNKTVISSLTVNNTEQLTATITPASTENKTVTWTTSNASIATVDSTGKVTAKAAGAVTITASSAADNTKFATCAINVTAAAEGGCGSFSFGGGMWAIIGLMSLLCLVFLFRRRKTA